MIERIADVPIFSTFFSKLSIEKHASYELFTLKKSDPETRTGTLSLVNPARSLMLTL